MKTYPSRRPAHHARVPAFSPVPLRKRADGWTPKRQAAFLAELAITRSVREAARRVGMARETAYRLRARPGAASFAAAWDAVLGRLTEGRRKVTSDERARRALFGLLKPVIYAGKPTIARFLGISLNSAEASEWRGRHLEGHKVSTVILRHLPPPRRIGRHGPSACNHRSLYPAHDHYRSARPSLRSRQAFAR